MNGILCKYFEYGEAKSQAHTSDGQVAPVEVVPSFSNPLPMIQAYKAEA